MNEKSWRYIGWVQVVMAAVAMVATLPGRTFGLGLITEPMLKDLQLSSDRFSSINFWATIVGAVFCFPAGYLLDRWGSRVLLSLIYVALGGVVCLLAGVHTLTSLLILVTLTRGLGQSALSVVSISMTARWFRERLTLATAIYSVVMSMGFMVAFSILAPMVSAAGWRETWSRLGIALLVMAPISWLLVRHRPAAHDDAVGVAASEGLSFRDALSTPAFWIFAVATSLFGLITTGFSLYNQRLLGEHGFDRGVYNMLAPVGPIVGLLGQALCAYLASFMSYQRIIAIAMTGYALGLLCFAQVSSFPQLVACVVFLSVSGGMITVIFFAVWPQMFGRRHLGRIQGAAQMGTVFASAVGPMVFTKSELYFGTMTSALYMLAPTVIAMAAAAWLVPLPARSTEVLVSEAPASA